VIAGGSAPRRGRRVTSCPEFGDSHGVSAVRDGNGKVIVGPGGGLGGPNTGSSASWNGNDRGRITRFLRYADPRSTVAFTLTEGEALPS
jgi:hypothetical protein